MRRLPAWAALRSRELFGVGHRHMLSMSAVHGLRLRDLSEGRAPSEDLSGYRGVNIGDLVVNKLSARDGALAVSRLEGIVSPAYWVLQVDEQVVYPGFLHFLLKSPEYLGEIARRSKFMPPAQFDLPWDQFRTLTLRLPVLDEQRRIANFLDDQVARLDQLNAARMRQVSLLRARSLAEMTATLSGSRFTSRRQSGIKWFGSIPDHWRIARVSHYFDVQLGKMLNEERARGPHPGPYLRNANVHWFDIDTDDMSIMSFEPGERDRYILQKGDLMVCEGGAGVGEAAVWDGSVDPCYFSKSLHRARPRRHLPASWLMFWLRLAKEAGAFEAEGNLATIPHLTGEQLKALRLPVPPRADTDLTELHDHLSEMRSAESQLHTAAMLLNERKQALITAAVTGQLDVTTARPVGVA